MKILVGGVAARAGMAAKLRNLSPVLDAEVIHGPLQCFSGLFDQKLHQGRVIQPESGLEHILKLHHTARA